MIESMSLARFYTFVQLQSNKHYVGEDCLKNEDIYELRRFDV